MNAFHERRRLLAAFLGTPWVLAGGCGRDGSTVELPPGELVGASDQVGHRLRDAGFVRDALERASREPVRRCRVVIVGGGVAGLSAARRLLQEGIDDFVLLELEREPGGTSRGGRARQCGFPWGAHYVPAPTRENPDLIRLLDELDVFEGLDDRGDPVVAEQFRCRYPRERVFYRGRWYDGLYLRAGASREDLRQLALFHQQVDRWIAWRDERGRRAFTLPMRRGSDSPEVTELDRISMADWMDHRGLDSPRLRWYVDYACRDDYGMRLGDTSAWAALFYFCSRTPAAGEDSRPFITWPEGNGRIVSHLYRLAKRQCRLGWTALDIQPTNHQDRPVLDVTAADVSGRQANLLRADRVIFAAPRFLARHVVRPYRLDPPRHLDQFQYGAWAVANLELSEPPRTADSPMAWDNVLYESPSLGYVNATYQRGLDHGPCLLTYYYPLCDGDVELARRRLLDTDRDQWAEIVLSDLERAHPEIRRVCRRLDVMRWGHAMIRPRPGFVWGAARRDAEKSFRGIHFAHCDLSGLALCEEAFYRGDHAAVVVARELDGTTTGS